MHWGRSRPKLWSAGWAPSSLPCVLCYGCLLLPLHVDYDKGWLNKRLPSWNPEWVSYLNNIFFRWALSDAMFLLFVNVHTSYTMLLSGIPWNMPRVTCIFCILSRTCQLSWFYQDSPDFWPSKPLKIRTSWFSRISASNYFGF